MANPAETAYLSVRDGELSNVVQLVEFWRRKVAVHTFLGGGPKPCCSDGLRTGTIVSHNFFVLGPMLVKFHIRTRLIEGFPMIFRTWWCGEEKFHFTPFHTLRQLKRDEVLIPPLGRVVEFRARYCQIPVRGFWGVGKIWRPCDLRSRSYKRLYTHTRTHAHKAINVYNDWLDPRYSTDV